MPAEQWRDDCRESPALKKARARQFLSVPVGNRGIFSEELER